jgi:hypothetical protein
VQPNQRRLSAERSDEQGDMVLPVVRTAEGEDLRVRHVLQREARPGEQRDFGPKGFAGQLVERHRNCGVGADKPESREKPGGSRKFQRRLRGLQGPQRKCSQWPNRGASEVLRRIGDGQRSVTVEPWLSSDQHRLVRVRSVALVRQRQSRGAQSA